MNGEILIDVSSALILFKWHSEANDEFHRSNPKIRFDIMIFFIKYRIISVEKSKHVFIYKCLNTKMRFPSPHVQNFKSIYFFYPNDCFIFPRVIRCTRAIFQHCHFWIIVGSPISNFYWGSELNTIWLSEKIRQNESRSSFQSRNEIIHCEIKVSENVGCVWFVVSLYIIFLFWKLNEKLLSGLFRSSFKIRSVLIDPMMWNVAFNCASQYTDTFRQFLFLFGSMSFVLTYRFYNIIHLDGIRKSTHINTYIYIIYPMKHKKIWWEDIIFGISISMEMELSCSEILTNVYCCWLTPLWWNMKETFLIVLSMMTLFLRTLNNNRMEFLT